MKAGLKALPEAVNAIYPQTLTQLCLVHLMRASMKYIASKDMKAAVVSLKRIYQLAAADEAALELDVFETEWGERYRAVVRLWRGN